MWFKEFVLNILIPTFLHMIPAFCGGLYECFSVYDIITVPLIICFLYGVILIIGKVVEYGQQIIGRIKNNSRIKKLNKGKK